MGNLEVNEGENTLTGAILDNPEHRPPRKGIVVEARLRARESCLTQLPPGESVVSVPASLAPAAPMHTGYAHIKSSTQLFLPEWGFHGE